MSRPIADNVKTWLIEPLSSDVRRAIERLSRAKDVQRVVVLPDVHLAREVCIGTVVATSRLIYPAAVGGDIGCGVAAIAFDAAADALRNEPNACRMLERLREVVPIIRHKNRVLPRELAAASVSDPRLETTRRRDGAVQFGTMGRGNHFLEFQSDDEGRLWLMIHSGSRAVGQAIRDFHIARAIGSGGGLASLPADSAHGAAYLNDAQRAREYARANRRAMIDAAADAVRELLAAAPIESTYFDCDHNHVARETHAGEELWVHRKGAMRAAADEPGIIPGSMGTESFHVQGRGGEASLCSSSHGAGRAMARDEARRRIRPGDLERQMGEVWFDASIAAGLREEAPTAYKDIGRVLRAQSDLTRVVRRLRPVLVYKGT